MLLFCVPEPICVAFLQIMKMTKNAMQKPMYKPNTMPATRA